MMMMMMMMIMTMMKMMMMMMISLLATPRWRDVGSSEEKKDHNSEPTARDQLHGARVVAGLLRGQP